MQTGQRLKDKHHNHASFSTKSRVDLHPAKLRICFDKNRQNWTVTLKLIGSLPFRM